MLVDLTALVGGALDRALDGYRHPLARLAPGAASAAWARERVARALATGGIGRGVVEDGRLVALAVLEPQAWESGFFGVRFGAIPVWWAPGDDGEAAARGGRLLAALLAGEPYDAVAAAVEASDLAAARALADSGFRLLDTKVTYALVLGAAASPTAPPEIDVRAAGPGECEALVELAREVFAGYRSRFTADPALPAPARAEFYATWMRNSFAGFADAVLVGRVGGRPAGFCTVKRGAFGGARVARIDLVGTAPGLRERGVFRALVAATVRRFPDGLDALVLVSKLDNYAVQAALATLGFRLVSAEYALHRARPGWGGDA